MQLSHYPYAPGLQSGVPPWVICANRPDRYDYKWPVSWPMPPEALPFRRYVPPARRAHFDEEPREMQVDACLHGSAVLQRRWDPLAPAGNGYFGREAYMYPDKATARLLSSF